MIVPTKREKFVGEVSKDNQIGGLWLVGVTFDMVGGVCVFC